MELRIGTSGFYYSDWPGIVYPAGTKPKNFFEAYITLFDTVELNSPLYHFPSAAQFEKWAAKVPEGFQFAVKASKIITHIQKLYDTGTLVKDFIQNASLLNKAMGPVLFQLPPGLKLNLKLLEDFLICLPQTGRYTIEFRNPSWNEEEVFSLLRLYKVAFCIYDIDRRLSPIISTSNFIYVRLHGPEERYRNAYDEESLLFWADHIREWQKSQMDIYIYFDNTFQGHAALNALRLKELIG